MQPTQKEAGLLKDLKDQEQLCVDKYRRHAANANDPQLKNLFEQLAQAEQQCASIRSDYEAQAKELYKERIRVGVNSCQDRVDSMDRIARMEAKKGVLALKQQMVGEAFDKVAKALGLGYPGGPIISKLAETGNPRAIDFPRALNRRGDYRFSLSGLKTAVVSYIEHETAAGNTIHLPDLAASFEAAVFDVQYKKAKGALHETGCREYCIGGGVSANPHLRRMMIQKLGRQGIRVTVPPLNACTDNAAMIAEVARRKFQEGDFASFGKKGGLSFGGWINAIIPILIVPYYSVIGGWVIRYLSAYVSGHGSELAQDG